MPGREISIRTIEESVLMDDTSDGPVVGLVEIFSEGEPRCRPIRLGLAPVELGRVAAPGVFVVEDDRVSRRHTRILAVGAGVRITDLGSRNGTAVDGRRIDDKTFAELPRVLRIGQTLFRFTADIRPFLRGGVEQIDKQIIGPTLRVSREEIARAAKDPGNTVLLTGPSGSGKELAARAFHVASGREHAPFVAVNCAAIPTGLAESLLFGARRGSHSAASSDTEGYVQSADKGTLFLDEIAELDITVQAKLLRVLAMREVLPLGATQARKVDVRICTATLKDLRVEVAHNRFREDLYFRIGGPEVRLPALIDRLEEMGPLALIELDAIDPKLTLHVSFIEAAAGGGLAPSAAPAPPPSRRRRTSAPRCNARRATSPAPRRAGAPPKPAATLAREEQRRSEDLRRRGRRRPGEPGGEREAGLKRRAARHAKGEALGCSPSISDENEEMPRGGTKISVTATKISRGAGSGGGRGEGGTWIPSDGGGSRIGDGGDGGYCERLQRRAPTLRPRAGERAVYSPGGRPHPEAEARPSLRATPTAPDRAGSRSSPARAKDPRSPARCARTGAPVRPRRRARRGRRRGRASGSAPAPSCGAVRRARRGSSCSASSVGPGVGPPAPERAAARSSRICGGSGPSRLIQRSTSFIGSLPGPACKRGQVPEPGPGPVELDPQGPHGAVQHRLDLVEREAVDLDQPEQQARVRRHPREDGLHLAPRVAAIAHLLGVWLARRERVRLDLAVEPPGAALPLAQAVADLVANDGEQHRRHVRGHAPPERAL